MKNFEEIDKYLKNKFTPEEKAIFEKKVKEDPKLAEEVKIQQFEEASLNWLVEKDLREQVKQYRQEAQAEDAPEQKVKVRKLNVQRLLAIAATIALVIIAFFWLNQPKETGYPELAQLYIEKYPPALSNSTKSSGSTIDNQLISYAEIIETQQRDDLEELLLDLKALEISNPELEDIPYYLGLAHFLRSDYPEAINYLEPYLQQIAKQGDSFKRSGEARFYLTMALLSNQQEEEAQQVAAPILSDSNHDYYPSLNAFFAKEKP